MTKRRIKRVNYETQKIVRCSANWLEEVDRVSSELGMDSSNFIRSVVNREIIKHDLLKEVENEH